MYHDLSFEKSVVTVEMLLLYLTISHLIVLTVANPFHKYPFVFLLDVGNEELEKTNTEQIRITVPGSSIALRYPAVGNGDTIAHVRVSGIDFGTDLKANIVDGGPGYNYVVLMFTGNPGVPYDAVVTIQTVPDSNIYSSAINTENEKKIPVNAEINQYKVKEDVQEINDLNNEVDNDENNSAEEIDEPEEAQSELNTKSVQVEPSLKNYKTKEAENVDNDEEDEDEIENSYDSKEYEELSSDNVDNSQKSVSSSSVNIDTRPKAEPYSTNDEYISYDKSEQPIEPRGYVDRNLYNKFKALEPHLYNDVKVYPETNNNNNVVNENYRNDAELDQMFNDEEIHNDATNYKDVNNNNFDDNDSNAVAY